MQYNNILTSAKVIKATNNNYMDVCISNILHITTEIKCCVVMS